MGDINKELLAKEIFGVDAEAKDMNAYSSIFGSLPNPDIVLKNLNRNLSAYYDLDIDDQVSAALQLRKDNVKSMDWELDPSKTRDDIFQFVNNVIKKWDMEKTIGEMLDAIAYGYSVMELIWLEDANGYKYISSAVGKPPHWFTFDTNNRLRFLGKGHGAEGKILSKQKFTVVQNYPTYLNPYGNAVFKKCYWPVMFKKAGLKFFAKFVEKYGMIHLLGLVGKNAKDESYSASKEEVNEMTSALDGLFQDGTGAIPGTDDVLVIKGNDSSSSEIYKGFIEVCDKQIAKAILSHSSAVDSVAGALGNREQITQSINIIRDSDAKLVVGNMNDIITKMVHINFGKVEEAEIPVYKLIAKGQTSEIKAQAETDTILKGLGVEFTKEYIKKTYSLQDSEFEISNVETAPPTGPMNNFSAQSEIEDTIADKFQKTVEPIINMINKGKSFEEIKESILEVNANLDTTELEELISDMIAVTQVSEEI